MSGAAPIVVGVLGDRPGPPGPMIDEMRKVVDGAVSAGRIDRPVVFVTDITEGLPEGTAANVKAGFQPPGRPGRVIIMGPSVTDNGLVVRDLADGARVPCVNWTGSERHPQRVDVPLPDRLPRRGAPCAGQTHRLPGLRRVAVVQDRSPIGSRYGPSSMTRWPGSDC